MRLSTKCKRGGQSEGAFALFAGCEAIQTKLPEFTNLRIRNNVIKISSFPVGPLFPRIVRLFRFYCHVWLAV